MEESSAGIEHGLYNRIIGSVPDSSFGKLGIDIVPNIVSA